MRIFALAWAILFWGILLVTGCAGGANRAGDSSSVSPCEKGTQSEGNFFSGRKYTTKVKFENADCVKVFSAAVSAVADEGFTIDSSDKESGIISGHMNLSNSTRSVPILVQVNSYQSYVTVLIKLTMAYGMAGGGVDDMCAMIASIEKGVNVTAQSIETPSTLKPQEKSQNPKVQEIPAVIETSNVDEQQPAARQSAPAEKAAATLVVSAAKTNVRRAHASTATVIKQLKKGDKVVLLKTIGDWYLIELPDGTSGWAYDSDFFNRESNHENGEVIFEMTLCDSGPQRAVKGVVSDGVDLTDEKKVTQLLNKGVDFASKNCPREDLTNITVDLYQYNLHMVHTRIYPSMEGGVTDSDKPYFGEYNNYVSKKLESMRLKEFESRIAKIKNETAYTFKENFGKYDKIIESSVKYKYDDRDVLLEKEQGDSLFRYKYNKDGSLVEADECKYGREFSKIIYNYNKDGRLTEETEYGGVVGDEQIGKVVYNYHNKELAEKTVYNFGNLASRKNYKYDNKGRLREEEKIDKEMMGDSYHKIIYKYNKYGLLEREEEYHKKLDMLDRKYSLYSTVHYKYDEKQKLISKEKTDYTYTFNFVSNKVIPQKKTSLINYKYDKKGNLVEKTESEFELKLGKRVLTPKSQVTIEYSISEQ